MYHSYESKSSKYPSLHNLNHNLLNASLIGKGLLIKFSFQNLISKILLQGPSYPVFKGLKSLVIDSSISTV